MLLQFGRVLFFCCVMFFVHAAGAVPMQAKLSPTQDQNAIIPSAAEIGEQFQALVGGGESIAEIEPQETFGTRALGLILDTFKLIGSEGSAFVMNFAALPDLSVWVIKQISDPVLSARWIGIGELMLLIIVSSIAAGWLADVVLLPLRRRINRKHFMSAWSRFGGIFGWLLLSFIPVVVFLGVALFIISYNEPSKLARFMVMTVVYALAIFRLVRVCLRFFLSPSIPTLRFIPLSTENAVYIQRWGSWFAAIMIARVFVAEMARVVKVPETAITGFTSLAALIVVLMTVMVIVQKRSPVSLWLRGGLSAARASSSLIDSVRLWLARTWHVLAISYLVIGYVVTMLGEQGGFVMMMQGTVGTLLALFTMRLFFYLISKLSYHKREMEVTSGIYRPVLAVLLKLITWVVGATAVLASWGADVIAIASSAWGQRVLGSSFSIASTVLLVVFVYEFLSRMIERRLNRCDANGQIIQVNSRARTLLPMVQKAAIMVLTVIVGLVTLSEFGINIAPLLAGAGVLGVAVGFGSQTLVKDFLTGLSIILEDNMSVGDYVLIGDKGGTVENLSIRTVRLRNFDGALHIIPFSDITTITNLSKSFAYAVMEVGVAYDSDLDHVLEVVKATGNKLRDDPVLKQYILDDIEVWGVDSLGDSSINIKSRIRTVAGKHNDVRRAFLLHIKKAFDAEHIEIPFPTVTHISKATVPSTETQSALEPSDTLESPVELDSPTVIE
ncbi:MAG: mechanosensitive ion channel [Alphaproteobacteria bacterium]|nr:mechanosensitive ion channel [Alphaproteobacteria bacterium]